MSANKWVSECGQSIRVTVALMVTGLLFGMPVLSVHAAAPPGQYTINNVTVRDNRTGLVWQRAAPTATSDWATAHTYCTGLNSGAGLGGFTSGWRLPTYKELLSIVEWQDSARAIDATAFPDTPHEQWFFWSSSRLVSDANQIWGVDFEHGFASDAYKYASKWVRCVR